MITGDMLARYLRRILDQRLAMRLYTVDPAIGRLRTPDDVRQIDGGGYMPSYLTPGDWQVAAGIPAVADGPVKIYQFDGTSRFYVYGSYLTQEDGGLLWVEPFPEPIPIGRRGDQLPVKATMRFGVVAVIQQ